MEKEEFAKLMEGLHNAQAHAEGDVSKARKVHHFTVPAVDPRMTRERLNMSRGQFATVYCINKRTLQGWEQGARQPDDSARLLVALIDRYPEDMRDKIRDTVTAIQDRVAVGSGGVYRRAKIRRGPSGEIAPKASKPRAVRGNTSMAKI